jgi:hypothetical protein
VELEVGDRVLACDYCRTRLYVVSGGPLRYTLPSAPEWADNPLLVHLPFWRLRGLRYRVLEDPPRVVGGVLDATVPAHPRVPPKASLGIRPQVVPLVFQRGELTGLPVTRTPAAAAADAERRAEIFQDCPPAFTRLIGETESVVYAPFLVEQSKGRVVLREALRDGKTFVALDDPEERFDPGLTGPVPPDPLTFVPLRCPECTEPLPALGGAVAFLCNHCERAWGLQGGTLQALGRTVLPALERDARHFPFWVVTVAVDGVPVESRGDLRRYVIPYQSVPEAWEHQPCQLIVPGFKMESRRFLQVARALSLADLRTQERAVRPAGVAESEPVRVSAQEAAQVLEPLLAHMVAGQRKKFELAVRCRVQVRRAQLLFLPYARKGREWVDRRTGTALQHTTVLRGTGL